MATFAIIGAGFSGTLLALHLLRRTPTRVRVVLIERQNRFAQGPAYATGNPSHLLNVPAGRMSAFHDRPEDFFEWLARQPDAPADFGPGSFAPRRQFGAYIRQLLHEELKRPGAAGRLELVRGDVAAIEAEPHGPLSLCVGTERRIEADLAVLAIGNFPPEPPTIADHAFFDTPLYRPDPWAGDALGGLDPDAAVLLIGTGLTMVDTVTSLEDAGHRGAIHALSRRGLTPRCHAAAARPPLRPGAAIPDHLTDCVKMLRAEARRAVREGSTWQAALDELRPFGRDLWQNLSVEDRSRFLRHLRPWWDVHRHRLAPEVSRRIDAAGARGQLTVHAGRIDSILAGDDGATVTYRPRGTGEQKTLRVARVVNCAGPACDFDRIPHPLVRRLLSDGMVRPDPHRLGLDVTPSGALKDRRGAISRQLFAVGPVTRGAFWEMTAVPDIRRQCELLAAQLAMLV
ncbi:MAG: Pyridine nucleotide-disulfide oxidoreductase family [Rhodospirillales bacterium]|nr:Pyridine nucleotide-disulfide oxidoreductase family [Rhodospirillales bacterium]